MRESTYLVLLLTLAKVYGQPRFGPYGSTGPALWASRSRDLSRQNSGLSMGPPRSNSGLGSSFSLLSAVPSEFGLGSGTGINFDSKPTKEYEEEDGRGGKTTVKEYGTPGSNSYGRQVTRTSGFFPSDAALPSRLGSTGVNIPTEDLSFPPSPPRTGFGGGSFRRSGSFGSFGGSSPPPSPSLSPSPSGRWPARSFSPTRPVTDSYDTNPTPQAPPTPPHPSLSPSLSRRWPSRSSLDDDPTPQAPPTLAQPSLSPLLSRRLPSRSSLGNDPTPPAPPTPPQPSLSPSLSKRWPSRGSYSSPVPAADTNPEPQPAATPTPPPSPYGYGRSASIKREDPPPSLKPSRNSSGTITINDETPDGRKLTIRMSVGRMTDEEESSIKRHIRNTVTILFYFPTWKCALVSRLQAAG